MKIYLSKNIALILKNIFSWLLVFVFIASNCLPSDALTPTTRFKPIVKYVEDDKGQRLVVDSEEREFFEGIYENVLPFQEDASFVYLSEAISGILNKAGHLRLGEEGIKLLLKRDLSHVDFTRFDVSNIRIKNDSVCVPYTSRTLNENDNERQLLLRYFVPGKEKLDMPGFATIPLCDGCAIGLEVKVLEVPAKGVENKLVEQIRKTPLVEPKDELEAGRRLINEGFEYTDPEHRRLVYKAILSYGITIAQEEFNTKVDILAKYDMDHAGSFSRLFTKARDMKTIKASAKGGAKSYVLVPQGFLSVFRGRAGITDYTFNEEDHSPYARAMHEDTRYYFVYESDDLQLDHPKGYVGLCYGNIRGEGQYKVASVLTLDMLQSSLLDGEELLEELFRDLDALAKENGCLGLAIPGRYGTAVFSSNYPNAQTIMGMACHRNGRAITVDPVHMDSWLSFDEDIGTDDYNVMTYHNFVLPSFEKRAEEKEMPGGCPFSIYSILTDERCIHNFVSLEDIRKETLGGRSKDGHLSIGTLMDDLSILKKLRLVEKRGRGANAKYRAVFFYPEQLDIIKYNLRLLGTSPDAKKLTWFMRQDYINRRIDGSAKVREADKAQNNGLAADGQSNGEAEHTIREMLAYLLPKHGPADYKTVAVILLEGLKNDFEFKDRQIDKIERAQYNIAHSGKTKINDAGFQSEFERILREDAGIGARGLKKKPGKVVEVYKYAIALGAIFKEVRRDMHGGTIAGAERARPFMNAIVEAAFDESFADNISLTSPNRSYHLLNDSAVAYWTNKEYLYKPKNSRYERRRWENEIKHSVDMAAIAKIEVALNIARKRAHEMAPSDPAYLSPEELDALMDEVTVISIHSPLPILFAHPLTNVVRPGSNGRSRRVLYLPFKFLEDFNLNDEEDMKELATHLLYMLDWTSKYGKLKSVDQNPEVIYEALNNLTKDFTKTDRYGLTPPDKIRKRLFKLMKQAVVAQAAVVTPELLCQNEDAHQQAMFLSKKYPKGYVFGKGDYDVPRDMTVHIADTYAQIALYCDLLGLHDYSSDFASQRAKYIEKLQSSEVGQLPVLRQIGLVLYYLRHGNVADGDVRNFLKHLDRLLTGEGFPKPSTQYVEFVNKRESDVVSEQNDVRRMFAANFVDVLDKEGEIDQVLGSLKDIASTESDREEIERARSKARQLISQFKESMTRRGRTSVPPTGVYRKTGGIKRQAALDSYAEMMGKAFNEERFVFKHLTKRGLKNVLIWDPATKPFGEAARTLPIVAVSLLKTFPGIKKIVVVTDEPEPLQGIDERITLIGTKDFNPASFDDKEVDLVMNFSSDFDKPPVESSVANLGDMGRLFYNYIYNDIRINERTISYAEAVHAMLKWIGLEVPPLNEPVYKKAEVKDKSRDSGEFNEKLRALYYEFDPNKDDINEFLSRIRAIEAEAIMLPYLDKHVAKTDLAYIKIVCGRFAMMLMAKARINEKDAETYLKFMDEADAIVTAINFPIETLGELEARFDGTVCNYEKSLPAPLLASAARYKTIWMDGLRRHIHNLFHYSLHDIETRSRFDDNSDPSQVVIECERMAADINRLLDQYLKAYPGLRSAFVKRSARRSIGLILKRRDELTEDGAFIAGQSRRGQELGDILKIIASDMHGKDENSMIIIGIETNKWMSADSRSQMQELVPELPRLERYLHDLGLKNLRIVRADGDGLAGAITGVKDALKAPVKLERIVVLASTETLQSKAFDRIKEEDKAFFAAIDHKEIELALSRPLNGKYPYIRIVEMLTIALKLAFKDQLRETLSDIRDHHPDIAIEEIARHMVLLIPKAEMKDPKELDAIYCGQLTLLKAA